MIKEITILSGKGGTGKTSISAALASISSNAVFCDSDVDAADMHLLMHPEVLETHDFAGGRTAWIDPQVCSGCGICMDHCRFDAISMQPEGTYAIDPFQCEGCRLCERVCPEEAITSHLEMNNHWFVSRTRFGPLLHATMAAGEENSGKLVTEVRKKARDIAREKEYRLIINDGPPGIGCPVIASITGTQGVLLVIEPTLSGYHDAGRVVDLVRSFEVPVWAVINKSDINESLADTIRVFLKEESIPLLATIPFDRRMVESMIRGKTIMEYAPDSAPSQAIREIWNVLSG